jgi:hypothetical protein
MLERFAGERLGVRVVFRSNTGHRSALWVKTRGHQEIQERWNK